MLVRLCGRRRGSLLSTHIVPFRKQLTNHVICAWFVLLLPRVVSFSTVSIVYMVIEFVCSPSIDEHYRYYLAIKVKSVRTTMRNSTSIDLQ